MLNLHIRTSTFEDIESIKEMYTRAFPDEDLVPLIIKLLDNRNDVLSLVGTIEEAVVAHLTFTMCSVNSSSKRVALLAPLCVDPAHQKAGVGTMIVENGLERIKSQQIALTLTLGNPKYYGRFGFAAEETISAPYPIPEEWAAAWQSLLLGDDLEPPSGKLVVPDLWLHEELWS